MFDPEFGLSLHKVAEHADQRLLDDLREAGVGTLEVLGSFFSDDPAKAASSPLRSTLDGLRVATVHISYSNSIDVSALDESLRLRSLRIALADLEIAEALGASVAVLHASTEPIAAASRPLKLQKARESLAALASACAERGLRLAVEMLPRSCLGNSFEELEALLSGLDPAVAGFCLDCNHLMSRPETLPSLVRRAGRRLFNLHLSDYDGVDERHWPPGEGVVDWDSALAALDETGYRGPFNYECNFPAELSPLERVRILSASHSDLMARLSRLRRAKL